MYVQAVISLALQRLALAPGDVCMKFDDFDGALTQRRFALAPLRL